MQSQVFVLASLVSTSLLLSLALAVGWARFGRAAHAATWAAAFAATAAAYATNIAKLLAPAAATPLTLVAIAAVVASFTLLALGFRQRAAAPTRGRAMALAALIAGGAAVAVFVAVPHSGWYRVVVNLYCAAMLAAIATTLRAADDPRRTGRGAAALVWTFATFVLGLAALAPWSGAGPGGAPDLYRVVLLLGLPAGTGGVGILALFLLAADLAGDMRALAATDPLTGALNRRGLAQAAEPLVARAARTGAPVAVVVADLDRFKALNDAYGHGVGDRALERFAACARETLRATDLVGRLGGEEFAFVLADADIAAAAETVARFRAALARAGAAPVAITASYGVAAGAGAGRGDTLAAMIARADEALYRAKAGGGDGVAVALPPPPPGRRARVPGARLPA